MRNIQNLFVGAWKAYSYLAGVGVLVAALIIGYLMMNDRIKKSQFRRAVKAFQGKEKETEEQEKTVEVKNGSKYLQKKLESIENRQSALNQKEEQLEQREISLDQREDRLEDQLSSLEQREEKLKQKRDQFQKRKENWRTELTQEHMKEIQNAVSAAADPFENPEEAVQLLHQYITTEEGENPDYEMAYKIIRSLDEEDRTTLIRTLSQTDDEDLVTLRTELFRRYGSIAKNGDEN